MNYFYTDHDYKEPFEYEVLRRLQQDVTEWDPLEYLPLETLSWCR
jgi:hypothetical protein